MVRATTITVQLSSTLEDFAAANTSENDASKTSAKYICDLLPHDKARVEEQNFNRLKAELQHAFAAPEASYKPLSSAEVIARAAPLLPLGRSAERM